jgi:hypothetical protein
MKILPNSHLRLCFRAWAPVLAKKDSPSVVWRASSSWAQWVFDRPTIVGYQTGSLCLAVCGRQRPTHLTASLLQPCLPPLPTPALRYTYPRPCPTISNRIKLQWWVNSALENDALKKWEGLGLSMLGLLIEGLRLDKSIWEGMVEEPREPGHVKGCCGPVWRIHVPMLLQVNLCKVHEIIVT